jgi:hypothetical protein
MYVPCEMYSAGFYALNEIPTVLCSLLWVFVNLYSTSFHRNSDISILLCNSYHCFQEPSSQHMIFHGWSVIGPTPWKKIIFIKKINQTNLSLTNLCLPILIQHCEQLVPFIFIPHMLVKFCSSLRVPWLSYLSRPSTAKLDNVVTNRLFGQVRRQSRSYMDRSCLSSQRLMHHLQGRWYSNTMITQKEWSNLVN